jgi:hypothetical protein
MLSNKKELFKHIDGVMFKNGFRRKGEVWYKEYEEIIAIFSVGKSEQTGQFGHIFGGFIRAIMEPNQDVSKDVFKHFYMTLSDYEPQIEVRATFNLSNDSFFGNERELKIEKYTEKYILPFFERIKSVELLKEEILKNRVLRAHTKLIAMNFLGVPIGQ